VVRELLALGATLDLSTVRAALFFLIHRFHSISVTRAQGIPKYKIGFGRGKDGRVGERLVEGAQGGGGHVARDGGWGEQPG
jgi:hypothetical protein